jgi:type IV fimbrial biogenesis protein FimT
VTASKTANSGYTLVEGLVVMAIAAILLTMAVPSYIAFKSSITASAITNELLASFQLARSNAVRSGTPTQVCAIGPSYSQPVCRSTANDASAAWQEGWLVMSSDGQSQAPLNYNASIPSARIRSTAASVTYGFEGRRSDSNGTVVFDIGVPASSPISCRRIVLTVVGHIRTERLPC